MRSPKTHWSRKLSKHWYKIARFRAIDFPSIDMCFERPNSDWTFSQCKIMSAIFTISSSIGRSLSHQQSNLPAMWKHEIFFPILKHGNSKDFLPTLLRNMSNTTLPPNDIRCEMAIHLPAGLNYVVNEIQVFSKTWFVSSLIFSSKTQHCTSGLLFYS